MVAETPAEYRTGDIPRDEIMRLVKDLEKQMKDAARNMEFEKAALLRDRVVELRRELVGDEEGLQFIDAMRKGGRGSVSGVGPMPRPRQGRARPRK
jgi:excinuclease ABC subunit B